MVRALIEVVATYGKTSTIHTFESNAQLDAYIRNMNEACAGMALYFKVIFREDVIQ